MTPDVPTPTAPDRSRAPSLDLEWLSTLAPPALPPRLYPAIDAIVPRRTLGLVYDRSGAVRAAYREHERDLPLFPVLADVGLALLSPERSLDERRAACVWLTLFPGDAMADALARVLLDDAEPLPLRDQAAWSLGFRQAQERPSQLLWPASALGLADDALVEAWRRDLHRSLPQLAPACRHVDDPRLFALLVERLDDAWEAIEAFGDEALARALLDALPRAPGEHVHRAVRLAAHVLGPAAAPALEAFARAAPFGPRHEALLAAVAVGSTPALEALDADVAALTFPGPARARRDAALASGGAILHVRALRAARVTATLPCGERTAACARACADFSSLARVDALHESYLHALWRHAAFGAAGDPGAVLSCVALCPRALAELPALAGPFALALCAAGRFDDAARAATDDALRGRVCWEAARRGRPFAALGIGAQVRERTLAAAAGEALGCFLAGRVDLAQAALDAFEPTAQDLWEAGPGGEAVACAVVARDLLALLSSCVAPPEGAAPDVVDLAALEALERRLRPRLDGLCVLLSGFDGRPAERALARARLHAQGARLLDVPFGRVDLVVVPDDRAGAPVDPRLAVRSVPVVPLSRALRAAPTSEEN